MVAEKEWFLDFLWNNQVISIVIIAVLLARFLMQKLPKLYSYLLWALVGLRMICMTWLPSPFSLFRLLPLFGNGRLEMKGEAVIQAGLQQAGERNSLWLEVLVQNQEKEVSLIQMGLAAFFLIWFIGMTAIFLYGLCSAWFCRRLVKQAVRGEGNIWECDNIPSPFVWGVFRPRIYLPFRLSEEERCYILEHECYHIQRKDFLVKLFAFVLLAVYWINPFVWLSYFRMLQDLEMSCDEAVLKRLGEGIKKEYSTSILAFAAGKRKPALGVAFGESPSSKRIRHVLQYKKPKLWKQGIGIAIAVLLVVLCLTNQSEAKTTRTESSGAAGKIYQIYPEILDKMGMTYPEYQELSGQSLELTDSSFNGGGLVTGSLPDSNVEVVMKGNYNVDKGAYEINDKAEFARLQGKLSDFVSIPDGESLQMPLVEFLTKLFYPEKIEIKNDTEIEKQFNMEQTCFAINIGVNQKGNEQEEVVLTLIPEEGAMLNEVSPDMTVWLSLPWEKAQ